MTSDVSSRRVRRFHTRDWKDYLSNLGQGILVALAGGDGQAVAQCIGKTGTAMNRDSTINQDPTATFTTSNAVLDTIINIGETILKVACAFKDQILKLMGYRRVRRHRRLFFVMSKKRLTRRRIKGIFDWIADKAKQGWNAVKDTVVAGYNYLADKATAAYQWVANGIQDAVNWTKQQWDNFVNGVNNLAAKIKEFINNVKEGFQKYVWPIIEKVLECGPLLVNAIMNIYGAVRAVIAIVTLNVVDIVVMIVNLVCEYVEFFKAVSYLKAAFTTSGADRFYQIGKFVGQILVIIGKTIAGKSNEEPKPQEKSNSLWGKLVQFLKDNGSSIAGAGGALKDFYSKQTATVNDTLGNDAILTEGKDITSQDGQVKLSMQTDGNLVVYFGRNPIWATGTNRNDNRPYRTVMQGDGNLVMYNAGNQPIWASGTNGRGSGPYRLVMQNDHNLVIYDRNNSPTWASNTMGKNALRRRHRRHR